MAYWDKFQKLRTSWRRGIRGRGLHFSELAKIGRRRRNESGA